MDAAKGATDPSAWLTPFIIAGVACLIGAIIMILVKPPKKVIKSQINYMLAFTIAGIAVLLGTVSHALLFVRKEMWN